MATRGSFPWHYPRVSFLSALPLLLLLFAVPSSASTTSQFQNFYRQHGRKWEYILTNNCSEEYANYLTGRPEDFELDWIGGGGVKTKLVQPVVNCLLDNASEYIKTAGATAQVILGVAPAIIATLGASTDELGLLAVVGRRPLLALLLSFGSPGVYMDRPFSPRQPEQLLVPHAGQYRLSPPNTRFKQWAWTIAEYIVAIGAAANIVTLSWQLGNGTVCNWWAESSYGVFVWTVLSIPIYMAGAVVVRLRVRRIYSEKERLDTNINFLQWIRLLPTRLYGIMKDEWVPAIAQEEIRTVASGEGWEYMGLSWLLSTATIIHVLFGSLVLSGLLFIGPQDALLVIFRYILSLLACRILVVFELAGMRHNHIPETEYSQ